MKFQKSKTPKRITQSIKKDAVHPTDFRKYVFLSACDDCSHFDTAKEECTFGYRVAPHRRAQQIKDYEMSGKMALCRFLEID